MEASKKASGILLDDGDLDRVVGGISADSITSVSKLERPASDDNKADHNREIWNEMVNSLREEKSASVTVERYSALSNGII